ncbi:MAG: hypothetical protein J6X34_11620, partial [Clostridia bacterium]|nr:hypothetical protein [Clostridia bacterium]
MNLKTTNRILSFILALIMVLGFLPANALAVFADGDDVPVRAGDEGYPDGYDPDSQASVYAYNRWGSGGDPRISTSIVGSENNPSSPLAGDTLNYVLKYTYFEIPEINFGYPKAMPIYDFYKNNSLTLVLPAGLLLKGQESPKGYSASPDDQDPTVPHTYTFPLADVDSNDPQQFSISVYVCNNGTDQSVATYDPMSLTFHTEFDVIDYTGGKETKVGHYKQEVSDTSDPIVTSTPDRWGVEKSIKDGYPKFTDNNTKAVFSWEVKVGLLDNDGNLITDVSLYNRPGRDAVESIWLKDTFSTLLSKDDSSPYGTITITKGSNSRQWYTTGTEIELELKDGLALDVSADADKVSINGTSDPNYLIRVPTLTTYTVTAEYNVTPEMIAKFYENPYELNSKNKAEVTRYTLARVTEKNGNETIYYPEDLELPVTEPASVTIGKLLREFAAGNVSNPYDGRYGDITFKISLDNGVTFTVYEYRESPAPHYVPIEGMTNVTSATLQKGVTYYLAPGITYKVEEVLTTEQLGYMVPESIIVNRGKADERIISDNISQYYSATYEYLSEGEEWTVDFVNKEVRGKIIVVKKDDGGNPVKGVIFALKDAQGNYLYNSNGEKITATTGDDGKATFKNVPYGTYQVVEDWAPEGYVMDPDPQEVTVAENSTEEQVTRT